MSLGRILVVDDEASVRKMVRLTLAKAGFDVVDAADGQQAVEAIRSDDNALMVDAIFCDIQMPRMNGMEAIDYFRAQFPSVPVVVITGQPDVQKATTLMKNGVMDYLVKPIESQTLVDTAKKAVTEHELFKNGFVV